MAFAPCHACLCLVPVAVDVCVVLWLWRLQHLRHRVFQPVLPFQPGQQRPRQCGTVVGTSYPPSWDLLTCPPTAGTHCSIRNHHRPNPVRGGSGLEHNGCRWRRTSRLGRRHGAGGAAADGETADGVLLYTLTEPSHACLRLMPQCMTADADCPTFASILGTTQSRMARFAGTGALSLYTGVNHASRAVVSCESCCGASVVRHDVSRR